jgi:hypothetical protein
MKSEKVLKAILVLSLAGAAQDKPNFNGYWLLDTGKSDFGHFPVPDTQTNVIEHKGESIKLTQTIKSPHVPGGEASTERHYTTDGKENVNRLGPRDVKSMCRWAGNKLIIVTKLETPDGTGEIEDSWELTDGGKEMVVLRDFKEPDGGGVQKLLFKKQQ